MLIRDRRRAGRLALTAEDIRRAIDRAGRLRREIERFERQMPAQGPAGAPTPPFSWDQVARQMADLAGPERAILATDLVSAARRQAWCKPPEMVLREVLLLAATLCDDSCRHGPAAAAD